MNRVVLLIFLGLLSLGKLAMAQIIVTDPALPKDDDSCTIIYDAALGNGELKNVTPPLYAHTGVITNFSTSNTDWKYVIADWNENTPKALLTPLGNNKYKMKLKPDIRGFYSVPATEQIEKMAFVFRNADGSKVGRNADGTDVLVDIYSNTFSVNIIEPSSRSLFLNQNDPIPVSASSLGATSMTIMVNGTIVKTAAGQFITETLSANNFGTNWVKQWVKIVAANNTGSVADSFSYTVIPPATIAPLPAGMVDGINYIDSTTVLLCLFAPYKSNVFVIGDFNNWQPDSAGYMYITPDKLRFWIQINHLTPKQEYIFQYLVDGDLRIGDPYADKVSDPLDKYIPAETYPNLKPYPLGKTTGIATFLQTHQDSYAWNMTPFTPPAKTDLVIYELLIRDFTAAHDFPSLIDTLDYLKNLGINAIELMPVMEFEGNESWGYMPDYSFAVDKYYGTKNGLKRFVEAAHMRGIAVILDIVCNHHANKSPLAQLYWNGSASQPAPNNPWLNTIPKHPYNVGCDFNHESPETKRYMKRLLRYWLTEFHVDGYRFDLSKGFTQKDSYPDDIGLWGQYDASRIGILTDYMIDMRMVNPNAYAILEHFADNSEEKVLSSRNMMMWGNSNYNYNEATMGWITGDKSDFSWISYKQRDWTQPHVVGYMESHDEERLAFKNISYGNAVPEPWYNVKDTGTSLKRLELAATFFFTIPGPKMIWQFGELGYDYSINYPTGTPSSRLAPKPIRWDYLNDWRRRYTKNIFATLAELKKTQPVFATTNYSMDVAGAIKSIWLRHASMDATVLGNFDVVGRNVIPYFTKTGTWYEFFTGDTLFVTDVAAPLAFAAGEYRLYTTVKLPKPYFTGVDEKPAGDRSDNGNVFVYPNPSGGKFEFMVNLPQSSTPEIFIYSPLGKEILRMSPGNLNMGTNTFTVTLPGGNNGNSSDGIYYYRLDAGSVHQRGKLMVVN